MEKDSTRCITIWDCETRTYVIINMDNVRDAAVEKGDEGLISKCLGRFVLEALLAIGEAATKRGLDPKQRCIHLSVSIEDAQGLRALEDELEVEDLIRDITRPTD